MSGWAAYLQGAGAILRRDFRLALSYRFRVVAQMLTGIFSLTLFYYISRLVRVSVFSSPDAYYAFAVIGVIILQVLNSTIYTPPMNVRQELVAGTFERLAVSPFGPVGALVAMMIFPFLYSLVLALFLLAFASVVYGVAVHWATVPLVPPVAVLGALAFSAFGMLIVAVVIVAKQAMAGTTWVVAGISLIAGLYFPVSLLPDWIQWMSHVQPFTPAVDLLRHLLVGSRLASSAGEDLAKLVGFSVVLIPVALGALVVAIRFARRRGTLTEY